MVLVDVYTKEVDMEVMDSADVYRKEINKEIMFCFGFCIRDVSR